MRTNERGHATALLVGALAACATIALIACSDDNPPAAATTTTSPEASIIDANDRNDGGGPGPDADAGAATCTVPPLGGAMVRAAVISGSPPTDMGGAITTGTYDLTGLEIYVETSGEDPGPPPDAGTSDDTAQASFVLTSDTIALSKTASPPGGGAPIVTMYVAKQHTSDVFLVTDDVCPGTDSRQTPFTVTANTIALHTAQLRREVYTRRP